MTIFKKTTESLLKYGQHFANKTEGYTKIAKVHLEIKKLEGNLDKTLKNLGQYLVDQFENNNFSSFDLTDDTFIAESINKTKSFKLNIEMKKKEIEKLKELK